MVILIQKLYKNNKLLLYHKYGVQLEKKKIFFFQSGHRVKHEESRVSEHNPFQPQNTALSGEMKTIV